MTLRYDNDYIVGGRLTDAVTPHFRLREFAMNGQVRVHRELAGALQELREACGFPLSLRSLAPPRGRRVTAAPGCGALVAGHDPAIVAAQAAALVRRGFLDIAEPAGTLTYVEIPDPARLPPLRAPEAMERTLRVTAAYETSGDPFQSAGGNFDGAGLSFGPLQVNFGSGTLPELFIRFRHADEAALAACFTRAEHWAEWQTVLALPRVRQVAWADANSTGWDKRGLRAPWSGYLRSVGCVDAFRRATLQYAYDVHGRKLIAALSWLKGLWPGRIDHFACLSALYDLCVQQGSLDKAHTAIRARVQRERPADQFALMHIALEERGRAAAPRWRADCISRRLGILYREPFTASESGSTVTRENLRIYLVRNVAVTGAERYLT